MSLYQNNPEHIDLFVGGLAEDPVVGGIVGPTFACLIAYQFHLIKNGDRRFYSHPKIGHYGQMLDSDKNNLEYLKKPKSLTFTPMNLND